MSEGSDIELSIKDDMAEAENLADEAVEKALEAMSAAEEVTTLLAPTPTINFSPTDEQISPIKASKGNGDQIDDPLLETEQSTETAAIDLDGGEELEKDSQNLSNLVETEPENIIEDTVIPLVSENPDLHQMKEILSDETPAQLGDPEEDKVGMDDLVVESERDKSHVSNQDMTEISQPAPDVVEESVDSVKALKPSDVEALQDEPVLNSTAVVENQDLTQVKEALADETPAQLDDPEERKVGMGDTDLLVEIEGDKSQVSNQDLTEISQPAPDIVEEVVDSVEALEPSDVEALNDENVLNSTAAFVENPVSETVTSTEKNTCDSLEVSEELVPYSVQSPGILVQNEEIGPDLLVASSSVQAVENKELATEESSHTEVVEEPIPDIAPYPSLEVDSQVQNSVAAEANEESKKVSEVGDLLQSSLALNDASQPSNNSNTKEINTTPDLNLMSDQVTEDDSGKVALIQTEDQNPKESSLNEVHEDSFADVAGAPTDEMLLLKERKEAESLEIKEQERKLLEKEEEERQKEIAEFFHRKEEESKLKLEAEERLRKLAEKEEIPMDEALADGVPISPVKPLSPSSTIAPASPAPPQADVVMTDDKFEIKAQQKATIDCGCFIL
jgi:hypothetical protein